MNRPELILFDAVGTLIKPVPSAGEVYRDCARRFGFEANDLDQRFIMAMHDVAITLRHKHGEQTSEEFEYECWRQVVRYYFKNRSHDEADRAFVELWQHFSLASSWRLFPDVEATMAELKRRGYQIGIASNFDARLINICRESPPLDQVDYLFVSSRVGWSKGNENFYAAIERDAQFPPSRILMIGDDCHGDYVAPKSRGWQARWLQRQAAESTAEQIRSLSELLAELA